MESKSSTQSNVQQVKKIQITAEKVSPKPLQPTETFSEFYKILARGNLHKDYSIKEVIGSGSFGVVVGGLQLSSGSEVAIKFSKPRAKQGNASISSRAKKHSLELLDVERGIYGCLKNSCLAQSFPKLIGSVSHSNGCSALIMQRLGNSVENEVQTNGRLRHSTCFLIAHKMVTCIENLHSCGLVHRDLKPDNFVFGRTAADRRKLYLIDFGLSKSYLTSSGSHISYKKGLSFIGNIRYGSINSHRGVQYSRRDDIQSMLYIFVYLLCGSLPWQSQDTVLSSSSTAANDSYDDDSLSKESKRSRMESNCRIVKMKEGLCSGQTLISAPRQISGLLQYSATLGFYDLPNYEAIRKAITAMYHACNGGRCGKHCHSLSCNNENYMKPSKSSRATKL